jgi:hypothetical protein
MQPYEKKLNGDLSRILTERNEMDRAVVSEWLVVDPGYEKKEVGSLVLFLAGNMLAELGWGLSMECRLTR